MTLIRISVWLICITALFVSLDCPAATSVPLASELLDKYTHALDSTQSFISTWESSEVWTQNVPSLGLRANKKREFRKGQYRTDNKGRYYEKSYGWENAPGSRRGDTKQNERYLLYVIGDDFLYRHNRPLGQTEHSGYIEHRQKDTPGWDTHDRKTWGYFDGTLTNSFFLGYVDKQARFDRVLRNARRISVRPKPEMLNGSACYVIEARTNRGDFKLWLDSEHGYHPARIQAFVGVGDDIGPPGSPHIITKKEGITRRYTMDNVRFEKVDDVWVPMEADRKSYIVLRSENGFSDIKLHFKRNKILLNPDHDALKSFADPMKNPEFDPELRNGTEVNLNLGDSIKREWFDGEVATWN